MRNNRGVSKPLFAQDLPIEWKQIVYPVLGVIWAGLLSQYNLIVTNLATRATWTLWIAGMVLGSLASMRCGLEMENINPKSPTFGKKLPVLRDGQPVTGLRALSLKKATKGCSRFILWMLLVWSCSVVRQWPSPGANVMAGTLEIYVVSSAFIVVWRAASRLFGDPRGEAAAQGMEDTIDSKLGIRRTTVTIEEVKVEKNA